MNRRFSKKADDVCRQYVGDEVNLRGLIEFSNICKNNCLYCSLRAQNSNLTRYRLSEDEIAQTAKNTTNIDFKTVVLQSGENMWFDTLRMCRIIGAVKKFDLAVTLGIGEKSYEEYRAFKNAGVDRYLLRIETTDKDLYHRLDPNMNWEKRIAGMRLLIPDINIPACRKIVSKNFKKIKNYVFLIQPVWF